MTVFIRPEFTPDTLLTLNGYHLQIFAAGRAKISLRTLVNNKKHEFFAARPKKDRAAYQRQKARSLAALSDHFAVVDRLLDNIPDAKVFRVHEKGNNNATADNAHVLASLEQDALWLVMSGVIHRWELTTMLVDILLRGKGKRTGEASIFNEYMPSYDHDWQDATFEKSDYKVGIRLEGGVSVPPPSPQAITPQRPSSATRVYSQADEIDDYDDPVSFTDPPHDPPEATFAYRAMETCNQTTLPRPPTRYNKEGLWAEVQAGR